MALHPAFPSSPYAPLIPDQRWFLCASSPLDLRLVGGYEVLYPKARDFMRSHFFAGMPVDLEDTLMLRNLSEPVAGKILCDAFKAAINAFTNQESGVIWIFETKGREELDLPQKMVCLKQWRLDASGAEENGQRHDFVFVDQIGFEKHPPKTFAGLTASLWNTNDRHICQYQL